MIYDPLKVAIELLKARVPDVPVSGDLVGHQTGSPRVAVSLLNISAVIRNRLDRIRLDVHAYGPAKNAALALAMRTRHALLNQSINWSYAGVAIADASNDFGPQDISDRTSREHRFVVSLDLYMYLRS
ncbi:hypothetical protein GCM10010149_47520 [Nonomuraea roseoviolacea subsp. roseoviolacea]|uniref:hypothetical protein n=1 Tax=Nonomuraea roseoviolacea TaxID=103837 RepID=UPI0031D47C6B